MGRIATSAWPVVCAVMTLAWNGPSVQRLAGGSVAPAASHDDLTFEDRVRAQAALERVAYSHQIGVVKPFEDAVHREVIEAKVRRSLRLSIALEKIWDTPVTAAMLEREADRLAQGTRLPERLTEIYAALQNDPVLIRTDGVEILLVQREVG